MNPPKMRCLGGGIPRFAPAGVLVESVVAYESNLLMRRFI
jgi:hypothetical protein